ncbi:MAG: hypothetical protein LIQ31_12170, partial [Planctomycetes bacterium]|nr:hypothetical protein [Planctomycetota bacterium]
GRAGRSGDGRRNGCLPGPAADGRRFAGQGPGVSPETVDAWKLARPDAHILVEADGAAGRLLKAPGRPRAGRPVRGGHGCRCDRAWLFLSAV